ncbi:uncharacterized protein I303_102350 [Kwoniella dejecticola CBS 10117]|uniref:Uncharacterized protein n=1 Tax=Kwoniella dejecticola CBS 10117 TaxID=1296121 RepID=A0A1A6AB69_9TREE|nr:uncharacterized protein I303_01509 [Kwoniella dejecticola CBS 10117]OBR87307.1 hypothetical protein I303_01509 [Kwoniella dejecticola CBS 10117]
MEKQLLDTIQTESIIAQEVQHKKHELETLLADKSSQIKFAPQCRYEMYLGSGWTGPDKTTSTRVWNEDAARRDSHLAKNRPIREKYNTTYAERQKTFTHFPMTNPSQAMTFVFQAGSRIEELDTEIAIGEGFIRDMKKEIAERQKRIVSLEADGSSSYIIDPPPGTTRVIIDDEARDLSQRILSCAFQAKMRDLSHGAETGSAKREAIEESLPDVSSAFKSDKLISERVMANSALAVAATHRLGYERGDAAAVSTIASVTRRGDQPGTDVQISICLDSSDSKCPETKDVVECSFGDPDLSETMSKLNVASG